MTTKSTAISARLARLRGTLSAEEPGARGLERMARNPGCQRLRALTIAGITPATAVTAIYQEPDREGQSPFAIGLGNRYEAFLYGAGAASLLQLYRDAGRLLLAQAKVVNMLDLAPGSSPYALQRRELLTRRYLAQKLNGDPNAPNLIIQARLTVSLLGVEHPIAPDVLVAADTDPFYRPAEVKSYPDRNGKTDPSDIRGACRQAAVAVVALRQLASKLGVAQPDQVVPPLADLVLRVTGSFTPTLRPMTLQREVSSLLASLNQAPKNLAELEMLLAGVGGALDDQATLDAVPNRYQPNCREFCALAPHCKAQAVQDTDPVLLGVPAREALASAGSLSRALDLLNGTGAPPRTLEERALQERMREADAERAKAVR